MAPRPLCIISSYLRSGLTVLAGLFVPVAVAAGTIDMNPDAQSIANELKTTIYQNVRTVLGADAKVIVTVRVNESVSKPKKPTGNGVEILYAPGPLVELPEPPVQLTNRRSVLVKSVEADVEVAETVDEPTLARVKAVVENTLKGLNAKVTVTKIEIPPRAGPEISFLEKAYEQLRAFQPLLGIVLASLVLTIGMIVVVRTMRASTDVVVEGITRAISSSAQEFQTRTTTTREDRAGSTPLPDGPPGVDPKHFQRNLRITREALAKYPMTLLRTLRYDGGDLPGLKWLIPNLSEEEQERLKKYLGRHNITKLAELERMTGPGDQQDWFQDFVERLMIRKIEERNLVRRALEPDKAERLQAADFKQLISVAKQLNTGAAWRILSDFLPPDELGRVLAETTPAEWAPVFQTAQIDAPALKAAVDQMLSALSRIPPEKDSAEERAEYYNKILVDPVLQSLSKKSLDQEDPFLDQLSAQSPDLAAMVRTRYWTLKTLERVPDDILTPVFGKLSNEQRVAILLVMPAQLRERLLNLIPAGNTRTVAETQLKASLARGDEAMVKSARRTARQFLDFLRQRHGHGEFELLAARTDGKTEGTLKLAS